MIPKFIKKILNPIFLQNIDQKFLLNYPRLWISRIHYVIYYSMICSIFQLLSINSIEINFELPLSVTIMFVCFELAFLIIGFWFYQQLVYHQNFNVLNQYGFIQPRREWLKDFCFNLICCLISSCPLLILIARIIIKINSEVEITNGFIFIFILILFCIVCHLNLLVFLQKYTELKYFSLSLIIFIFGVTGVAIFTDLLVDMTSLTNTSQISLIKKLVVITITSGLIFTAFSRNNNNSSSSHINIVLLPYMITFTAICLVSLIENQAMIWLEQVNVLNSLKFFNASWVKRLTLYLLSSIAFLPFLPYLAHQLIKKLSYPKEI